MGGIACGNGVPVCARAGGPAFGRVGGAAGRLGSDVLPFADAVVQAVAFCRVRTGKSAAAQAGRTHRARAAGAGGGFGCGGTGAGGAERCGRAARLRGRQYAFVCPFVCRASFRLPDPAVLRLAAGVGGGGRAGGGHGRVVAGDEKGAERNEGICRSARTGQPRGGGICAGHGRSAHFRRRRGIVRALQLRVGRLSGLPEGLVQKKRSARPLRAGRVVAAADAFGAFMVRCILVCGRLAAVCRLACRFAGGHGHGRSHHALYGFVSRRRRGENERRAHRRAARHAGLVGARRGKNARRRRYCVRQGLLFVSEPSGQSLRQCQLHCESRHLDGLGRREWFGQEHRRPPGRPFLGCGRRQHFRRQYRCARHRPRCLNVADCLCVPR